MPNFPPVTIGVITYKRPDEIRTTLNALVAHLSYDGPLRIMISDDSSGGTYLKDLIDWWTHKGHGTLTGWHFETISTKENAGWGRNANHLLNLGFEDCPYLFMMEDDYVLKRPLDLSAGVTLMQHEPTLGMLRYRATAGMPVLYYQRETNISDQYPNYQEYFGYTRGRVTWLELLSNSPSLWLYSNGPHLKNRDFHGVYGRYPVGEKLGITEEKFAHIVKDTMMSHPATPKIGVLPEWIYMHWDHIGKSYQHTEFDK